MDPDTGFLQTLLRTYFMPRASKDIDLNRQDNFVGNLLTAMRRMAEDVVIYVGQRVDQVGIRLYIQYDTSQGFACTSYWYIQVQEMVGQAMGLNGTNKVPIGIVTPPDLPEVDLAKLIFPSPEVRRKEHPCAPPMEDKYGLFQPIDIMSSTEPSNDPKVCNLEHQIIQRLSTITSRKKVSLEQIGTNGNLKAFVFDPETRSLFRALERIMASKPNTRLQQSQRRGSKNILQNVLSWPIKMKSKLMDYLLTEEEDDLKTIALNDKDFLDIDFKTEGIKVSPDMENLCKVTEENKICIHVQKMRTGRLGTLISYA